MNKKIPRIHTLKNGHLNFCFRRVKVLFEISYYRKAYEDAWRCRHCNTRYNNNQTKSDENISPLLAPESEGSKFSALFASANDM